MKDIQNELSVEFVDDNNCIIHSHITARATGIPSFFMGKMIEKHFDKGLQGFFKDWKTYAETGEISAAKQKELVKQN